MFRAAALLAVAAVVRADVPADAVPVLPGYGAPPTAWRSGYLTYSSSAGTKHAHYIFVQSPNPTTDPVAAWFNGGPGCSSLEGAFGELGQLLVDLNNPTNLVLNNYSWNKLASMLYIEAPACVGYSYADDIAGCTHDDTSQAVDNLSALLQFFSLYPEFSSNPFYITGESYAGIYVPTLAAQVVASNAAGVNKKINLVGIAVGNGCLGNAVGLCSFDNGVEININVPYLRGRGMVSTTTYNKFVADCPVGTDPANPSQACNLDITTAHNEVGNVNIYNTIGDCIDGVNNQPTEGSKKRAASPVYARAPVPKALGGPIECIDEVYQQYINTASFQTAFHVAPLNWAVCGSNSSFNYDRTMADERVAIYPSIVAAGVRVLVYNGDADACVPLIDNAWWTASMNYTTVNPWHAWSSQGQVAGWAINYQPQAPGASTFTFASVRAAGHMVPQFQPGFAYTMFKNLVSGTPF